jgi:hypothetical protein
MGRYSIEMRAGLLPIVAVALLATTPDDSLPPFEVVQPELFSAPGGQTNAWADYDGDGDLDEFVGFRGRANRLYRQDHGVFAEVAGTAGIADTIETRAAAWGDYDADGDADLYIGFAAGAPNKLYRNDGGRFTDVAHALAVDVTGITRQASFVDYDHDGDLDLFVAFRERPNRLAADRARASLAVDVVDARGRHTKAGAEVRVYAAGTRRLVSSAIVDTGSGYCSQNVMPVHLGVAATARVDVEVTLLTNAGRRIVARRNVDPRTAARPLVITGRE